MSLADRLVILDDGEVAAVGDPRSLYGSPPNRFVASFLGRSNVIPATVEARNSPTLRIGERTVRVGDPPSETERGEPAVHVRPSDLVVGDEERIDAEVTLPGTVRSVADVASRYDVHVRLDAGPEVVIERRRAPPEVDDRVAVGVDPEALTVLPNATDEPAATDADLDARR